MSARQHRRIAPLLSALILFGLLLGTPVRVAVASSPSWKVFAIGSGESVGSFIVPSGNPGSVTLSDLATDYGYALPLLLAANSGSSWGDCNLDGDRSDAGEYTWPTIAQARDGASTSIVFCGDEEVLLPKLVEGAAISIVAGAGGGTEPNSWNGTSIISATTSAAGLFTWDGTDYFGTPADLNQDGTPINGLAAADDELIGTKVVVSASGYGVAAANLERIAFGGTNTRYTIISLVSNGRPMEVVNAFGGQTTNVAADGAPCTFYVTTSTSPSLWRSFDCGGTWAPVVLSSDERAETAANDGVEGIEKNAVVSDITTSGWPGEVAVTIQGKLWFSRDFGTSWNSFDLKAYTQAGSSAPTGTTINGMLKPFWAHAYDDQDGIHSSYLFLVGNLPGGSTAPLAALTVYATVMPTGDEYSIVDDNITATDNPCDGFSSDCAATEIKPGQFFELTSAMRSKIAGGDGTSRATWTGWLFGAKAGLDSVYIATQQAATGGVVIAKLPKAIPPTLPGGAAQTLFTTSDLKTGLSDAGGSNFTLYNGSNGASAEVYEVVSPFQDVDVDVDGCANGCAMSRDVTVVGGQAATDLLVFGGPSGVFYEDVNQDGSNDNSANVRSTDYLGPRSVAIWDRTASGPNSVATVRVATWVTDDRAISNAGTYDDADHWETAATSLAADTGAVSNPEVANELYSRGGNSLVDDGCLESDTIGTLSPGQVGQPIGGGDAQCAGEPSRRTAATCGENTTSPVGSLAPMFGIKDSAGFGQAPGEYFGTVAMIRSCVVAHGINVKGTSDIGAATGAKYGVVVVMDTPGANNNTGSAFDSGFNFESGLLGSSVVISGDGARGLVKAANWLRAAADGNVKFLGGATPNYVPLFPQASHSAWNYIANRADAGTIGTSGGFAVTGLAAPVVRDTAFNPSDPDGVVATFSFTGGGRSVISYDGGQHYYTFAGGGSNSIAWWKGASSGTGASEQGHNWILSGSLTGGGLALAHFTDEQWLTAKDIANGVRGDDDGNLENGVSGCEVGVDANCVTVDFDAPVETLSGSALVAGAIREQRPNPGLPGARITGCSAATNELIRGDMFDGAYFGLTGSADTVSITGIQGTDAALVVLGAGPSSQANSSDAYTVVLMKLKADGNAESAGDQPCVDDLYYLNGSNFVRHPGRNLTSASPDNYTAPQGRVASASYCPADGGTGNSLGVGIADAVEDLALIAIADESSTGGYDDGKLIKIKGIFGNSITVSTPATTTSGYRGGNFRDMKMDCDSGLVFLVKKADGTGTTASTAASLYSLDGAATFAPMGFASSVALKNAISSAETIAVEADVSTGTVDVMLVASDGNVMSTEMNLEQMMPSAATLSDLNDELPDTLTAIANDPSAAGDVSTVNDPASADGFYFGGEKPGDIDYPASEDEAPPLIVDGTDESVFAESAGFGIASASLNSDATPIFGSGGGALDVTAQMAVFSFGSSLTVPYKVGHATTTSATTTTIAAGRWHALPTVAEGSGAKQAYSVASTSSAYCELKSVVSGGVTYTYLRIKKLGSCKVGISAAAAAPYLAGTNYYTYVLSKGVLAAPASVPATTRTLGAGSVTLGAYADDAGTAGYQATSATPTITWSEVSGGTASANACKIAGTKLTFAPVAGDATKTCKIKGTAATSTNWGSWTVTYTLTFAAP
jgi:hypothetical protein